MSETAHIGVAWPLRARDRQCRLSDTITAAVANKD
jgi:hypothetical protein